MLCTFIVPFAKYFKNLWKYIDSPCMPGSWTGSGTQAYSHTKNIFVFQPHWGFSVTAWEMHDSKFEMLCGCEACPFLLTPFIQWGFLWFWGWFVYLASNTQHSKYPYFGKWLVGMMQGLGQNGLSQAVSFKQGYRRQKYPEAGICCQSAGFQVQYHHCSCVTLDVFLNLSVSQLPQHKK